MSGLRTRLPVCSPAKTAFEGLGGSGKRSCNVSHRTPHLFSENAPIRAFGAGAGLLCMDHGDQTFETLVQSYRQPLTRAAYHLCGDRDAACDIVQEAFLDAYRGFGGLRDPAKAGSWLYAILRRKAAAHSHARRSETGLYEEPVTPGPDDSESMVRGIVIEQMSRLSVEDREILAGKYLFGLSYKELADSLGIKEGAVRVRCLRAKERLRGILQGVGVRVPER